MSAEGQYYRYIVNRRQNSERGFLHMYTGNYECLELFVKPEAGKKGSVSLKKVKENKTYRIRDYCTGLHHYLCLFKRM